jgi:hypothetical protein
MFAMKLASTPSVSGALRLALILGLLSTSKQAQAQTTTSWNSASSATWSTAGNWTGGAPATGPQVADYPGTSTLVHTLDLAGATGRVSYGALFDFTSGGVGYTFNGTAGAVSGFFFRAGGPNNGVVNNDDNTQTFNVPIKLTSATGVQGAAAAMVFNAALGDMVFNGNNNAPATPWTINLNGASNLVFTGSGNISVGTTGPGQIVNTNVGTFSGLVKNGTGTLFLGGTAANTFVGTNVLNLGTIQAGKLNALGANNSLILGGGTFAASGFSQTWGSLELRGNAMIDFGSGTVDIAVGGANATPWTGSLVLENWTAGSDTFRIGATGSELSADQLSRISWLDLPGYFAQQDAGGFIIPVAAPEPSIVALGGIVGLCALIRTRRSIG